MRKLATDPWPLAPDSSSFHRRSQLRVSVLLSVPEQHRRCVLALASFLHVYAEDGLFLHHQAFYNQCLERHIDHQEFSLGLFCAPSVLFVTVNDQQADAAALRLAR